MARNSCPTCEPYPIVNFCIVTKYVYEHNFIWKSNGTPQDLTGYSARLDFKEQEDSPTAVLTLSDGAGITLGGAAGTIDIKITTTQTALFVKSRYVWDLRMIPPGGDDKVLVGGNALITVGRTA